MASSYMTPGVYIEEKNAFPGSAVAVETAVPVFIGYTEKAERKGVSLIGEPIRVTSFAEYVQWFGHGYNHVFNITNVSVEDGKKQIQDAADAALLKEKDPVKQKAIQDKASADKLAFKQGVIDFAKFSADFEDKKKTLKPDDAAIAAEKDPEKKKALQDQRDAALKALITTNITAFKSSMLLEPLKKFYFYNCIRLFYQNGGSNCYIMSLGTYGGVNASTAEVNKDDFTTYDVFKKLEKAFEPTMVVIPDFVSQRDKCYELYVDVLKHCQKTQSRFGIFDVIRDEVADADDPATILYFRGKIGSEALNYGAAYYPWLNSTIVNDSEVNFKNLNMDWKNLQFILPEPDVATVLSKWEAPAATDDDETTARKNKTLHQSLLASSIIYTQIMAEVKNRLNLLPPSAAMAGIYSMVDGTRGVWKAPANVSLSMVSSPAVNISSDEQMNMNVDATTGKSVNAIRPFPGLGSLVWGARTLDGNSQDWRYINVRRTMIMIEQSLKLACRAYVFEPNDSSTWVTMKSMMNNFLNNLWKQGALAGAVPEQAFDVQVGLGATMTPTDILDGYLLVTVKLALVRPAEFIVLTFQQQQQQS